MLYRLRRADGTADPFSAGTFVHADGSTTRLTSADFTMSPVGTWSERGYATSWRIDVPVLRLALDVEAAFAGQELVLAVRYWEGMVRAEGTRDGDPVSGRGYLEMTGYDE
jgi:predicted secreted hydrolase